MNKEQGAEPIIERGMIMADCIYEVKRERFHLNQNNKYILQGLWPKESKAEAYLDHEPVEVIIEEQTDIGAMERSAPAAYIFSSRYRSGLMHIESRLL